MAKRGFFAEVQHQARLAEQQRRRQVATHARELAASQRSAEQAQRAAERSYAAAVRMSAAEQKLAQAEAKRLHEESMKAQADPGSHQPAQRNRQHLAGHPWRRRLRRPRDVASRGAAPTVLSA